MRLEMNRKTFLAIEAIWALTDAGDRVLGATLAKTIGTSTAFIAQVMNPLVRSGWVASVTGPGGGYTLDVEPDEISM
ncbi:MAG: Rrf2 family transcriptional regulator, partial [Acidimicrobiia bacterium]|nr:Rrf2 family transcriptional regulator [Acidimicrobiia bacterium]